MAWWIGEWKAPLWRLFVFRRRGLARISEAGWDALRVRYETTRDTVGVIAAEHGVAYDTLWRRARKAGWTRPGEAPRAPLVDDDGKLLGRLFRAFERQIADLEQRFLSGESAVEERDARTLAVLAKTFETLAKLRDAHAGGGAGEDGSGASEEGGHVDLDELRQRLARRLDALLEAEGVAGIAAAGDDGETVAGRAGGDRA